MTTQSDNNVSSFFKYFEENNSRPKNNERQFYHQPHVNNIPNDHEKTIRQPTQNVPQILNDYHNRIDCMHQLKNSTTKNHHILTEKLYPNQVEISESKSKYKAFQNKNSKPRKKYYDEYSLCQFDLLASLDDFSKSVCLAELYQLPAYSNQNAQNRLTGELMGNNKTSYDRYNEPNNDYPRMHRLNKMKQYAIEDSNHPSMTLKIDPMKQDFETFLNLRFDTFYVNPPEKVSIQDLFSINLRPIVAKKNKKPTDYEDLDSTTHSWQESLPLNSSFKNENLKMFAEKSKQNATEPIPNGRACIFLWCRNYKDLSAARNLIRFWGFKYVEEIIWVKCNDKNQSNVTNFSLRNKTRSYGTIFNSTKEYCLVGVSGNAKRNVDHDFIHSNCDIDLIVHPELPNNEKPSEIFEVIERFCLGKRRVQIFGTDKSRRHGWLTMGDKGVDRTDFEMKRYQSFLKNGHLVRVDNDMEILRPKSPSMKEMTESRLIL